MVKLGGGTLNAIYPVGSVITTSVNANPSGNYGGTWEQIKVLTGGELIAFGSAYNNSSNSIAVAQDSPISFSDNKIPDKQYSITDFVGNVLSFDSGTFRVNTRGIVGMVEAIITFSGFFDGNGALWFVANANQLPNGITIHNSVMGPILGNTEAQYGGASRTYFYKVDDAVTSNLGFYINPAANVYNTNFTPCIGGVTCELLVKAYAKKQVTYMWKRTA